MTSEIRVNKLQNRVGLGTVEYTNTGIVVSGIVTANSFSGSFTGDLDVDGHTNLDNVSIAGVVTATSFSGDGSNLTGITQTTINSNTNNYLITGTGTANTLQGESTLTYNGSGTLEISDSGSSYTLKGASAKHEIGASASDNDLVIQNNKNTVNAASNIIFKGSGNGGESVKERFRIDSNGNARLGPGGNNTNSTNFTTLTISNTAGGVVEFLDSGNNNIAGDLIGAEGSGMYLSSKQDTPIIFRTGASNTEKMNIASDGNVHINTTDNGTASAKLNIENSASVGVDVLKIINKPSGANGKAKMVFYTETSQGQGCSPYIQSVSGADAGPNASDGHNAGGFEFHTRSGGSGTDNNAMRIRDDGTVEKYGSVGQILLSSSGAEIEFTRASSSNITCSNSAGFLNFYTGGQTTFPAIRIFAAAAAPYGAKVGINTDTIGVDAQMYVAANPGMPGLYSSYGMRLNPNGDSNNRISNATGVYALSKGITADNSWHTVAIGRYHAATVTIRVGDAASKRSMFINYDLTAPNYGVAHYNIIANNGNWNTGSADFQISSSGSYDYALQVKHSSYYNSSNSSGVYMIFNVA